MRGKILGFDTATGSGAISGNDGRRYSFRTSEWRGGADGLIAGLAVDFDSSDGSSATEIWPNAATVFQPGGGGGGAAAACRAAFGATRHDGAMLWRHPFLSLATLAYLGLVGLVTLTPGADTPDYTSLAGRVLAKAETYRGLDPITMHLSVARVEFGANIAMFVPIGVFFLLLFGARLWWLALLAGVVLTLAIETAQRSIPGRVSDPRDLVANSLGALAGVLLALVLTLPDTLRRRRARRRELVAA